MRKHVWVVFVIFAISVMIYLVLPSNDKQESETIGNFALVDRTVYNLLEICSEDYNIESLQKCKNEALPEIISICVDDVARKASSCSDPRIEEIIKTIDQKLNAAREGADESKQESQVQKEQIKQEEVKTQSELPYLFFIFEFNSEVVQDHDELIRICNQRVEEWENKEKYDKFRQQEIQNDLDSCHNKLTEVKDICDTDYLCSGIEQFENAYSNLVN